jgi:hypothetical protein
MKTKVLAGAAVAAATVSLALAGAVPAQAKGKHHSAAKPAAEKHNCGGKNGCPAMGKGEEKAQTKSSETKSSETKPAETKPADGK